MLWKLSSLNGLPDREIRKSDTIFRGHGLLLVSNAGIYVLVYICNFNNEITGFWVKPMFLTTQYNLLFTLIILLFSVRRCLTFQVVRWHRQRQNIWRTACAVNFHKFFNCVNLLWTTLRMHHLWVQHWKHCLGSWIGSHLVTYLKQSSSQP